MAQAMLVDLTKCIGCRSCQVACKKWHDLPGEQTEMTPDWTNPPALSDKTWQHVVFNFIPDGGIGGDWKFVATQCMHCLEPACVSACPVAALHKTDEGPVNFDQSKCIGCRYCIFACPWSVPRYQWEEARPKVTKCSFCVDRTSAGLGLDPACAQTCPTGCLTFYDDRDAALAEARARIANPDDKAYVNHIYGENEAGGTSFLYISDVAFEDMNFLEIGDGPLPQVSAKYLTSVPMIVIGGAVLFGALMWYNNRRAELAGEQTEDEEGEEEPVEEATEETEELPPVEEPPEPPADEPPAPPEPEPPAPPEPTAEEPKEVTE